MENSVMTTVLATIAFTVIPTIGIFVLIFTARSKKQDK